jgi:hypothetical protein
MELRFIVAKPGSKTVATGFRGDLRQAWNL